MLKQAVDLGLEDGQRLRVDTTVVETDIHFPTDGGLLWDSVQSSLARPTDSWRTYPRLIAIPRSHAMREASIPRDQPLTRQQRHHQQLPKYKHLIRLTEEVVALAWSWSPRRA